MENVEGEPDPFDFVIQLGNDQPDKKIIIEKPEVKESNAIKEELRTFSEAIHNDTEPIVPIEDGSMALQVATEILKKIEPMKV